jgi:hypothetical protein
MGTYRFPDSVDMADSLDLLGSEWAHAREIRALRREISKVAAERPVARYLGRATTYRLEVRPGIKVQATVCASGEVVASFTRETGPEKTEVVDTLSPKAARKVLHDLRHGFHNSAAPQMFHRAPAVIA